MARDIDKVSEEIRESLKDSRVNNRSITTELQTSFIDYAMSVITSRALPDVRDGLKPVHRRILYAAYNLGMVSSNPYKKSARLVGEVIGKYHPHGDGAVYEASVRMAQDFSLRYPLVDGHGNFGSIDGDGAAAMRYTEQRLAKITNELLDDIDKNTIDWSPNYDGSEEEPTVLPSAFPNLLANGSTGIAVGMSTVIPPHNLIELIDASIHLAKNTEATIDELAEIIKGPDFPTYAQIVGTSGIRNYFHTGKGSITIRSKYEIENHDNGKSTIIFTELPYMVTKSNLIERIVKLVREEVIEGINDLRDETSREGIRVIIETKKDVIPEIVLNKLFKHTELQTNISVNMIALVAGVPKQLNIKECLHYFLEHQYDVLVRKVNYELKKAKDRHHILQGIFNALHNIELVIEIIKNANDTKEAKEKLIANFQIDEVQADAILEMKLRTLSGMERNKVEEEMKKLQVLISDYEETLNSKEKQTNIICDNLTNIKNKYGDERRTEIIEGSSDIEDEELIPKEDVVITLSKNGYLKRIPVSTYRVQNRGGVGVLGLATHNDDDVNLLITTNTHIDLLLFSDKGKVYRMRAHQIPSGSRQSKGMPALNLINIEKNENILTILPIDSYDEGYLFFVTKNGTVKRTKLEEFNSIRTNGKIAITLKDEDTLINVFKTLGNEEIYLGSTSGHLCRFNEQDVREMGRTASGVRGIRLVSESDYVIGSSSSSSGGLMLSIGENGFGKLSEINLYRLTKRGSKGVVSLKVNNKTGRMIFAKAITGSENLLMLTSEGKINRISLEEFKPKGRSTSGVKLINMDEKVKLISASIFQDVDENEATVEDGQQSTEVNDAPVQETNNTVEVETVENNNNNGEE